MIDDVSIEEKIAELAEYYQKDGMGVWVRRTSLDVLAMAKGGNPDGIRQSHYQGWTNDDFKKLWVAVGEDPDEI